VDYNWIYKTKSAFTGILLPLFGIIALFFIKDRRFFLTGILVFFFLAMGPYLGSDALRSPLYYLYERFHIQGLFRISIRAYFICTLLFTIGSLALMERWGEKLGRLSLIVLLFTFVVLIENVPYKFQKYNSQQLMIEALEGPEISAGSKVLHLPSSYYSGFTPGFDALCELRDDYEFEVIREYLYMYRQTYDHTYILNGFAGFLPETRMQNQRWILAMEEEGKLDSLIIENDLDYIVWNRKFNNGCDHTSKTIFLREHARLNLVSDNRSTIIFACTTE